MPITRKTIRERAADSLSIFLDSLQAAPDSPSIVRLANITDVAIDDERFRWYYVYVPDNNEFRLVTAVNVANGAVTLGRDFTANVVQNSVVQIYGLLNPDEWNSIIDNEVMPALFREDRVVIPLVSGTYEYNATSVASWLTTEEQIIRMRLRDQTVAIAPREGEAPAVYIKEVDDHNVWAILQIIDTNQRLVIEARRYYTAFGNETSTVNINERLVVERAKYQALKRIFQRLGAAAKRIYGQQMVLTERDVIEEERRRLKVTVRRDWSDETEPIAGNPDAEINWTW